MTNQELKAIEEARINVTPILKKWRMRVVFSTTIRIEQRVEDNTIEGIDEMILGTIAMITEPVEYLRIDIWQKEFDEFLISSPTFPGVEIRKPTTSDISFYDRVITEMYKDGPSGSDWEKAEQKYNNYGN